MYKGGWHYLVQQLKLKGTIVYDENQMFDTLRLKLNGSFGFFCVNNLISDTSTFDDVIQYLESQKELKKTNLDQFVFPSNDVITQTRAAFGGNK